MTSRDMSGGLGRRFIALTLAVVILPLGLVGLWATQSAAGAGRELLRSQLSAQLDQVGPQVEGRWEQYRSELLTLGENEPVRIALRDSAGRLAPPPGFLTQAFARTTAFRRVEILDHAGRPRFSLVSPDDRPLGPANGEPRVVGSGGVRVRIPIVDLIDGDTIGSVDATVRPAALLPDLAQLASPDGPLIALESTDGSLIPAAGSDPRLFADESVEWGGHRWLTVHRTGAGPIARIALAGAVDNYVTPFRSAAVRGAIALFIAAAIIVLVVSILTRRITADVERELAHREALAAVGEFASELAHEIRNPLTALRLDVQRVEEVADDAATVRAVVPRVLRQIDRLDRAVTGALRVARGGTTKHGRVDIGEAIAVAARTAEPEFRHRGATLDVTQASPNGVQVEGDGAALEQLFVNLMINAAQAISPGGSATVAAKRDDSMVEISISDTGSGMSNAQLAEVQNAFRTTRRDGTGLGLKIARRIVNAHRGQMQMTSELGQGTQVRIRLPCD